MTDRDLTGLYCFLGGLGAGVAIGMLFAPDSGAVTRENIRRKAAEGRDLMSTKADEGREYLKRQGSKLADQTSDLMDRGKQAVSEQKDKVSSAVEAGKSAYRAAVSEKSYHPSDN